MVKVTEEVPATAGSLLTVAMAGVLLVMVTETGADGVAFNVA